MLTFDVATRTVGARPLPILWGTTWEAPQSLAVSGDSGTIVAAVPCTDGHCLAGVALTYDVTTGRAGGLELRSGGMPRVNPQLLTLAPEPNVAFTVQPGAANALTSFDASGSTNAGGTVTGYTWNFGDGSAPVTTTTPTVSHTYTSAGDHTATLTTSNDGGCAARFAYSGQSAACSGLASVATSRVVTVRAPTPPPGSGPNTGRDRSRGRTPAKPRGALAVRSHTLRVRRGAVRVKVRCDSATTRRGELVLSEGKTRYAAAAVVVKAHRTVTKRLQLSREQYA